MGIIKRVNRRLQKFVPRWHGIFIGVIVFLGVFGSVNIVFAQDLSIVASIINSIAMVIIELVGKLLVVFIEILKAVVNYNDFIRAVAVERGWVLVRDVANMAFLIIFVAIAFATILGIEKYEYKKLLPKLLIMAIAINFSKTIAGIVIDAAQVLMMTFVKGFEQVAAGNLIRSFGLNDLLAFREFAPGETGISDNAVSAASILAVILLVIATVTVGIIVIMFLIRIIFLWILIVLAPAAFLLGATPGLAGKFDEWWNKLVHYAFMGPILAFFLWLSFSIMAGVPANQNIATQTFGDTIAGDAAAAVSVVSRSDLLLSYIISIALLLLSLSIAQSMGVAGGQMAGDFSGRLRSGGMKLAKLGGLFALGGGAGLALGTKRGRKMLGGTLDWLNRKQALYSGIDLNLSRPLKGIKESMAERKMREEMGIPVKAAEGMRKGGLLAVVRAFMGSGRDAGDAYIQGAFNIKGFRNIYRTLVGGPEAVDKIQKEVTQEKTDAEIAQKRYMMRDEALRKENFDEEGAEAYVNKNWEAQASANKALGLADADNFYIDKDGNKAYLKSFMQEYTTRANYDPREKDVFYAANPSGKGPESDAKRKLLEQWEERKARAELAQKVKEAREYKGPDTTVEGIEKKALLAKVQELGKELLDKKAAEKGIEAGRLAIGGLAETEIQDREKDLKGIQEELEKIDRDIRKNTAHGLSTKELDNRKKKAEENRAKIGRLDVSSGNWVVDKKVNLLSETKGRIQEAISKEAAATTDKEKSRAQEERGQAEKDLQELKKSLETGGERQKMAKQASLDKERFELLRKAPDPAKMSAADRDTMKKEASEFENQAAVHADKANKAEARVREHIPPRAFYAERNRRLLEDEELKKITSKLDTELIADFKDAVSEGNAVKAVALAKKLANDYNDNELWNAYGFDSTAQGMQKFIDAVLRGKKGIKRDSDGAEYTGPNLDMDEQTAFAIENDIGYINESRKHWETSRTIKVENGLFKRMGQMEHAQTALAEIVKGDSANLIREFNRLAFGGETPRADGTGRDFKLTPLGAGILSAFAPEFHFRFGRGEYNKNAILNIGGQMDILRKLGLPEDLLHEISGKYTQVAEKSGKTGPDIAANMYTKGKGMGLF